MIEFDAEPDDGEICAGHPEHDWREMDERDGIITLDCTRCGAESFMEADALRRSGRLGVPMRSAGLLLIAALLTVGGASHANAEPIQQRGCASVLAAFMSGTGEGDEHSDPSVPVGMLADTANALRQKFGDDVEVVFPASPRSAFDKGLSYGDSKQRGDEALRATLAEFGKRCPASQVTLVGYSQGADSAGDVASDIGCKSTPVQPGRVLAVGLVSDPRQGTTGGTMVGPQVSGQGISGPRPQGFCGLSSVVAQFCDPADKYCSTEATKNPLIAGLGRMLNPDAGDTPNLATDFSAADPGSLESDVSAAANGDPAAASSALGTVHPLAEVSQWVQANPAAQESLRSAPAGSPEQKASGVLDTLGSMDLAGAVSSLESIGRQVAAPQVTQQASPLTSTPVDQLSVAVDVLGVLKPSSMIDQVTNVVTNSLDLAVNMPQVLDRLGRIGPIVAGPDTPAGKVAALQGVFGELNNLLRPLVVMSAGVDLHMAASVLKTVSVADPSGAVGIASVVVGLLGNVDVVGVARTFGQLQNNLWGVARAVAAGDLVGAGAALLGLVPTLLGFASLAVSALTSGAKSDVSELGGLPAAAGKLATAKDAGSLNELVGEGVDALKFFTSGAHTSYDKSVIDSAGRTALQWLRDWLTSRIAGLAAR